MYIDRLQFSDADEAARDVNHGLGLVINANTVVLSHGSVLTSLIAICFHCVNSMNSFHW